jgi:hypothetical protein
MVNAISLASVRDYEVWFQGGGPAKAGIPIAEFAPLTVQVHQFRGRAKMFAAHLGEALDLWSGMPTGGTQLGDNAVKANLGLLAVRLALANSDATELLRQAGTMKANVQVVYGVIERYARADAAAVQVANIQLQAYETQRAARTADYNAARAELEGGEGFLNGFLTGVTLTIYNPAKDNMDRARNAIADINASINGYNSQIAIINARQAEIRNSALATARIEKVDSSVVQCQNALNGAQPDLLDALSKLENADQQTRARVVQIYIGRAKPAMDTLGLWKAAFADAA